MGADQMRWTHPERRKLARLPLEVLVRIQVNEAAGVDFAETCNVSARGLYLYTRSQLVSGQELECVLVLPQRLTHAPAPVLIGCCGRVLRLNQELPGDKLGVAVEIHSYDFSWHGEIAEALAAK
jgi:PilZ domain